MSITVGPIYIQLNGLDSWSVGPSDTDGSTNWFTVGNAARQGFNGVTDYYQAGYIFRFVGIPQGATILSATIGIWTHPILGGRPDTVTWKVTGLDVDDAIAAGAWSTNYRPGTGGTPGRGPETTAKVDWDRVGFAANTLYTSPDISSIIQEIVNRPGWAFNNHLAIMVRNDGTNTGWGLMRHAVLDQSTTRATRFDCTYETESEQAIIPVQII